MGHHVSLQERWGAEDFGAGGAGVVLAGVGFVDVLAVLLEGGKAHPALLAVVGIFDVCRPETQQKPQSAKKSEKEIKELRGEFTEEERKGIESLATPQVKTSTGILALHTNVVVAPAHIQLPIVGSQQLICWQPALPFSLG